MKRVFLLFVLFTFNWSCYPYPTFTLTVEPENPINVTEQ